MKVKFHGFELDITDEKKQTLKEIKDKGGCVQCSRCPLELEDGFGCLPTRNKGINAPSASVIRDRMYKELYKIVFTSYVQEEMEL